MAIPSIGELVEGSLDFGFENMSSFHLDVWQRVSAVSRATRCQDTDWFKVIDRRSKRQRIFSMPFVMENLARRGLGTARKLGVGR